MVDFLWDRGRPRTPVAQKASGRKLFVLRTRAGEAPAVPVRADINVPILNSKLTHYPQTVFLDITFAGDIQSRPTQKTFNNFGDNEPISAFLADR